MGYNRHLGVGQAASWPATTPSGGNPRMFGGILGALRLPLMTAGYQKGR